jgi:hypothetical protein
LMGKVAETLASVRFPTAWARGGIRGAAKGARGCQAREYELNQGAGGNSREENTSAANGVERSSLQAYSFTDLCTSKCR